MICGGYLRENWGQVALENMLGSMVARDHSYGHWCRGGVGLAQSLQGLSPIQRHGVTLVYEGRLDNRFDLSANLSVSRDASDGEMMLEAYLRWGVTFARELKGDFACSVWDSRTQNLILTCDSLGKKPLYYCFQNGALLFASEICGLFHAPIPVPRVVDDVYLALALLQDPDERELTLFQGVKSLPGAHTLCFNGRDVKLIEHWRFPRNPPPIRGAPEEIVEQFCHLFSKVVGQHSRSEHPVGVFLSGGLDSTAVAAYGLNQGVSLSGLSWALPKDHGGQDERLYIERFKSRWPNMPHTYVAPDRGLLDIPPEALQFQCGYSGEMRHFVLHATLQRAAEQGLQTLLTGDGGDHTASSHGDDYPWELLVRFRWSHLLRLLREERQLQRGWRRSLASLVGPLTRVPGKVLLAARWRAFLRESRFVNPDFLEATGALERLQSRMPSGRFLETNASQDNRWLMYQYGPWQSLAREKFRLSRLYGIECRFPLLDREVMEFCLAVPTSAFRDRGWKRLLLRRACRGLVPSEILWNERKVAPFPDIAERLVSQRARLLADAARWRGLPEIQARLNLEQFQLALDELERQRFLKRGRQDFRLVPALLRAHSIGVFLEFNCKKVY
ncbi:MAG TPA: hypothetical protein EYO33_09440 [Phycisphaerales bacterium]|nr:hypothetical protein [Phycisphaerales bacterium]